MVKIYTYNILFLLFPIFFFGIFGVSPLNAQSFSQNNINFNGKGSISAGTSLMFGPDGRLYVAEYTGLIKIFTLQRNGPGDYIVLDMESLNGIQGIQDHNDDGSTFSNSLRETTGLTVTGTSNNPIIYVASSDFRIGGGGGGGSGDLGLDTNSGVITRFSWNGTSWDVVDIVRGLPRSEENHATNGLEFVTIKGNDYLILAQGGHTNAGSPSANFAYTSEYALSAAILSVNLSMLEGMPILTDKGRKYIYDIPTLDDPTRPNANGITDPDISGYNGVDVNDPFGGNDGLNQAMVVPGGPVQIFSPGYRNAYDLVVTTSGAVYVTDNGANGGWGGFPENEGGGSATNKYLSGEPGSTSSSGGEQVNNVDHLTLVTTNIQNYSFGSFYGGHPNPIRANPNGAGLYTNPSVTGTNNAVFRTQFFDPNGSRSNSTTNPNTGLPANWPPISLSQANSIEGDWRGPGISNPDGPNDAVIVTWGTNTNGIDEYTASNFNNAMKGDLIAGVNTGLLRRVQLKSDGTLQSLNSSFASGIGGDALGVTCNSDSEIFPGTIWVVTLNGKLVVLEPQDFTNCLQPGDSGYSATADYDLDGYTNQDEIDNGTDHCNGASQPNDFDQVAGGALESDLKDLDDDNDGILDSLDPFQLGDLTFGGSDAFVLPVNNELFSSTALGGYMGLGLTGFMNNGDPNPNWLAWLDRRDDPNDPNPNDILGGAIGAMTMHMTSGTAYGTSNSQEKGFQYGVQVDQNTGTFIVQGSLTNFNGPLQLYGNPATPNGELGFFIGDGTQGNYIKFVITKTGLLAQQEINDVPQTAISSPINQGDRPRAGATFYFMVNPTNGHIDLEYAFDAGTRIALGSLTAQGSILKAIQQSSTDLAVGMIGTSNEVGVEVEGTWDFLKVASESPTAFALRINAGGPQVSHNGNFFFADQYFIGGSTYTNNNVQVPTLYKSERSSSSSAFNYTIPIPNDNYLVVLHFAEIYWGATGGGPAGVGKRIFDVSLEGTLVMDNYDIYADVGPDVAVTKSFNVLVNDGLLHLDFSALLSVGGVDQPKLSAIEVLSINSEFPPVTIAPIANQVNQIGENVNFSVSPSGGDPNANFGYTITGQPSGIQIEPTNGLIFGTIGSGAATGGPNGDGQHNVSVSVSKPGSATAKESFSWAIGIENWVEKNENENYTARHECSFVQAGNKFYLMGGRENAKTMDIYDYGSNSWISLVNSAPVDFNHYQATEYGGLIWVIGAFKTNAYPNEVSADYVWAFDPSSQEWIQGPEFPAGRKRGSAGLVVFNDKFYIVGGNSNGHDGGYVPWFDEYDPATGIWTPLANAPRARDHFHAVVIGDKLYAAGGRLTDYPDKVFNQTIPEVDVYDFTVGTWSSLDAGLPTLRGGAAAVNYNNKLLVIGGEVVGSALKTTEEYDPATGLWTTLPELNHQRHGTQAIVSGNGVFITAGSPNQGGGNQKNMEFLGVDAPVGTASIASTLSAPSSLEIDVGSSSDFDLGVANGNVGVFVKSMQISGPNANEFSIISGGLADGFLMPNTSHLVTVAFTGSMGGRSATLLINHGSTNQMIINLESTNQGNQTPVAVATSDVSSGNAPLTVAFTGTNSTDDVSIASYLWEFGDAAGSTSTEADPSFVFTDAGVYTVTLTVTDDGGLTNTITLEITVNTSNGVPVAVATSDVSSGDAPLTVVFTGSNSTDDGSIASYLWEFGDTAVSTSTEADPTFVFTDPGVYTVTLTVTDDEGLTNATTLEIMVNSPNGAPIAVATSNATSGDAPLTVTFTGSNSTDDGSIASYLWEFGDTAVSTSTEADPTFVFTDPGVYTVTLTVTDDEGLTSATTLEITVNTPNEAPVAVATSDVSSGDAPLTVAFTGINSTDDVGIANYLWEFGDAAGSTSTESDPSFVFTDAGVYTVTLTVTDDEGLTNATTLEITVNSPNGAPIAVATSDITSGDAPLTVSFTGNNSTDDGSIASYLWEFGDTAVSTSTEADPTFVFTDPGVYTVTLTVTDNDGMTDATTLEITVNDPVDPNNEAPVAAITANPINGIAPLPVLFSAENATDDKGIVQYEWDFNDGTTSTIRTNGAAFSHTFAQAGTYQVVLTVTDQEGLTGTATITITVSETNAAPTAIATATPLDGNAPLEVTFDGSASTDDIGIVSHTWDFGDGTSSTETSPIHTYGFAGEFNVVLTISDVEFTDTAELTIVVTDNVPTEVGSFEAIVAPNPVVGGIANIIMVSEPVEDFITLVYLHDASGRYISGHIAQTIYDAGTYRIPTYGLRSGIYFVTFLTDKGETLGFKIIAN